MAMTAIVIVLGLALLVVTGIAGFGAGVEYQRREWLEVMLDETERERTLRHASEEEMRRMDREREAMRRARSAGDR